LIAEQPTKDVNIFHGDDARPGEQQAPVNSILQTVIVDAPNTQ
jgi:hypothetical protein